MVGSPLSSYIMCQREAHNVNFFFFFFNKITGITMHLAEEARMQI
jgi:hypothetical protein